MSGQCCIVFDQFFYISHIGVGSTNVDNPVLALTEKTYYRRCQKKQFNGGFEVVFLE